MKKLLILPLMAVVMALIVMGCSDPDPVFDTRKLLTAGPPVSAAISDTSAVATFTGASGLTLNAADFVLSVSPSGVNASITDVTVTEDTVSVTVTFEENTDEGGRTYTVSIASSSQVIRGSTSVAITQLGTAGAMGSIAMKLVNQTSGSSQNTPDNTSFITLNKLTGEDTWRWSGTPLTITSVGSPHIDASGAASDTGIVDGTLLYADIVPQTGFTLEAKMRITNNTNRTTGVVTGVIGNVQGFAASNNFKGFVGLVHRAESFRHMHPFDLSNGVGLRVGTGGTDEAPFTTDFFTYRYTVNGDGTDRVHYSGRIIRGGTLADITGDPGGTEGHDLSVIITEADRYPGIIVYGATIEISEITLSIAAPDDRTVLTLSGTAPTVLSGTTGVEVTYTGDAAELAALSLTVADFSITSGATIDDVDVTNGTVTVSITLDGPNMDNAARNFTLSTDSDAIVASNVTITHSPRQTLVAGNSDAVDADDETATVTFTGVQGLVDGDLTANDFTVDDSTLASISSVTISEGTVTINVEFDTIDSGDETRIFTIGINSESIHIMGNAAVTITQGETRAWLTAGDPVSAAADDESATVTFTGATGLALTDGDFTVTDATIGTVNVTGDEVSVQVLFDSNDDYTAKTYTVGIDPASTLVVGTPAAETVTITQAAAPRPPVTMKLINQIARTDDATPNNDSFIVLNNVPGQNIWQWTAPAGQPATIFSTGDTGFSAAWNDPASIGTRDGTLLYADISQNGNFTIEAKILVTQNTTANQTGVIVGVAAGVQTNFTGNNFKGLVGIVHRPGQFRHFFPVDLENNGIGISLDSASAEASVVEGTPFTYRYAVNGDGTSKAHYSGSLIKPDATLNGAPSAAADRPLSSIITDAQRYPGIIVYGATIEISEITLTIVNP